MTESPVGTGRNQEVAEIRVSIAMATYNGALYIREQLDSLAAQTRQPDELIVTDDGSTDDTLAILEAFQSSAPFEVKVYRNERRLDATGNFERAFSLCSGNVIFACDQDDVWFPNKIEQVLSQFTSRPEAMVVINDHIVADEKLHHQNESVLQQLAAVGRGYRDFYPGCCAAMRSEWRNLALPIPTNGAFGYDLWINTLADVLGARLVLPEPLQFYRRHAANATWWPLASTQKAQAVHPVGLEFRDGRPGWLKEAGRKRLCLQRLRDRAEALSPLQLEERGACACKKLELEIRAIERRVELMDLPRGLRAPAVARFLVEGGYANFSGWKSALKDVLR